MTRDKAIDREEMNTIKNHPKYIEFISTLNKERKDKLDQFGIDLKTYSEAKSLELLDLIEEIRKEIK